MDTEIAAAEILYNLWMGEINNQPVIDGVLIENLVRFSKKFDAEMNIEPSDDGEYVSYTLDAVLQLVKDKLVEPNMSYGYPVDDKVIMPLVSWQLSDNGLALLLGINSVDPGSEQ